MLCGFETFGSVESIIIMGIQIKAQIEWHFPAVLFTLSDFPNGNLRQLNSLEDQPSFLSFLT